MKTKIVLVSVLFAFLWVVPARAAINSLNGQSGATQTFATSSNNQNVKINSSGNVHTIDWVSVLQSSKGGTGASSFATGSVLFFRNNKFSEDNTNLNWDDTNNRLGIGTSTPSQSLHLYGASAPYLRIQGGSDGSNYGGLELWDLNNNRWQIINSAENSHAFQIVGNNFGGGYKFPLSINATTTNVGINNLQNATTTLEVNGSFGIVSETSATTSLYKFTNNGDDLLNIQRSGASGANDTSYTLLQLSAPARPDTSSAQESTLTLFRQIAASADSEFVDWFQNYYPSGTYPEIGDGIRVQKRGSGSLQPFSISYSTGLGSVSNVMWIQPSSQSVSQGGNVAFGISTSTANALVNVNGTFYVQSTSTFMSTIYNGDSTHAGCLAMGDSDGAGVTYLTANDGVLSATTTKPGICQ